MKRLLMILVSALLVTGFNGCGSPDTKSGTSAVTINLGETKTASPSGKILGASSIPTTVVSVRFTISASDMATIERTVFVEGRTSISETFDVPNGANRHFLVEVMDASGNVLYRGDAYANLDGAPISIAIPMVSADTTPPTFGGLVSATSTSSTDISLSWSAATDDVTASSNMVYLIYMSTTSGGENFASPSFTTQAGATSFTATGLSPATTYYFVARAKDEAGNIDANTVEKPATTLSPPDTTPPIISSASPANNATGISITSTVTATFSEAMDPSTITDQTLTLSMPGEVGQVPVSGTVTYSGTTATFTPSALLFYETTYTATITTGAKDLAGNSIASPYTWSFTTGTATATVVTAIAGGYDHTIALKSDGTVWAWGYNFYGQLGDGTSTDKNTPVQVSGLTGVTAIASGNDHTIALKSDGTVWAWGFNGDGQLGDGTLTNSSTPVQVSGL